MIRPVEVAESSDLPPQGVGGRCKARVSLEFLSDASAALAEWKDVELRLRSDSLACSHVWTQTWLAHYGDLVPHRFVVARDDADGNVRGICLVTEGVGQKDGPFPVRTWHLGTAGEPEADSVCIEYNRLLVEDGHGPAFLRALHEAAAAEARWDEFRLDGFAEEDCRAFLESGGTFGVRESVSRYFDLARAREESRPAMELLGYATRKIIRKNLKGYGELRAEWAESPAAAESIFEDMVALHQRRWNEAGRPGSYASRRFVAFHRDLIARLLPTGRVILFRVTSGREVVGCVQLFVDRNRGLVYQGGSAPYSGKLSPGLVVDYLCIEECLRRGLAAYDFLAGDSLHKQRLTTDSNRLCWAVQRRPRLKFGVAAAARWTKRFWQSRTRGE